METPIDIFTNDNENLSDSDVSKIKYLDNKRDSIYLNNEENSSDCKESITEIDENSIEKSYFTSNEIIELKENIIKLFYLFDTIIFTDDYKIKLLSKVSCNCWFLKKKYIDSKKFPGILFISFNSINLIKKIIKNHNIAVLNESNKCDKHLKFQICFDEGEIYKNMVYKQMQIQNKLLFIPMSKYQLKLTEYKLRGFCQIMEELGAIEIEINFNHHTLDKKNTKLEMKSSDIDYIAGSFGFSASSSDSNGEEIAYKLIYPTNNTFILNANTIIKKISSGKYIISKKRYDSNLELQYIINSRCRHFITNYSTVFTLDNSLSYDLKLINKLKVNKFDFGFDTNSSFLKNLKLSINTKVKFCNQKCSYRNLQGDNVSWDSVGFNYLLGTLNQDNFEKEGIYKIMFFINRYIDKVIYKKDKMYYKKIKNIYKNLNKEFCFSEFTEILLNYFNINSHWLHLLNFIDILVFKSVSYDKLGFLVLMSQDNLIPFEKNLKIINFIRNLSKKENIEENFWEMLEPNKYYSIITKFEKNYDILGDFNWFNIERLLYDLKKYKISKNLDVEDYKNYRYLYDNFILGHKNSQFEYNIKPFIIKYINNKYTENLRKIDDCISNLIFRMIKERNIIYYNVNTIEKLDQLIENKFLQLEEVQIFYNEYYNKIKENNISQILDYSGNIYIEFRNIITSDYFKNKYPFIYRNLIFIVNDFSNLNELKEFCCNENVYDNIKKFCINMLKKIALYNFKFNLNSLDLNEIGFNKLLYHIKICNYNNTNLKIKFFINLSNFIINQKITELKNKYVLHDDINNEMKKKIDNCYNFKDFVDLNCNFLNKTYNLNINDNLNVILKN